MLVTIQDRAQEREEEEEPEQKEVAILIPWHYINILKIYPVHS